jgi:hypothetical protein
MESKIVGQLKPLDFDPDFFESEPYPIPYFNNEKLKIGFVEAKRQRYLSGADQVLENFLNLDAQERRKGSQLVTNYYTETLKSEHIKPLDIFTIDEIWNFVYPTEIIIDWDEKGDFYLWVSCGCKWEEEHGLQLVFKNGLTLIRAGGHDGGFAD